MIWVCKTILSDGLDKCYFLQKNVEVLITPTIILEPHFLIIYLHKYALNRENE